MTSSAPSLPLPSRRREAIEGIRLSLPLVPALVPFGAIYVTLALEAGFQGWQALLASATIVAGASQYAMLELMGQQVPAWSILLTVVAINARHVLYSAAIGRHLGRFSGVQKVLAFFVLTDPAYASAERRVHHQGSLSPVFYFAYAISVYGFWMLGNLLGLLFGDLAGEPARYGLDFILPVYFIALITGFRGTPRFLTIGVSSAAVSLAIWATLGSPWHIALGGLAGLLVAACSATAPPASARDACADPAVSSGGVAR